MSQSKERTNLLKMLDDAGIGFPTKGKSVSDILFNHSFALLVAEKMFHAMHKEKQRGYLINYGSEEKALEGIKTVYLRLMAEEKEESRVKFLEVYI